MKLAQDPRLSDGPGMFAAVLAWAREVVRAVNTNDSSALSQADQIAALQAAIATAGITGEFKWFALTTAPAGWVVGNGNTIGSAASGATRANADTQPLFNAWWSAFLDAQLPILTSAGAGSTRGASAAADWAAGKRLTVFDMRDRFIRGGGLGYAIGTKYAATEVWDNFGTGSAIVTPGTLASTVNADGGGSATLGYNLVAPTGSGTSSIQTAKVRPLNIAMLGCFKL